MLLGPDKVLQKGCVCIYIYIYKMFILSTCMQDYTMSSRPWEEE